MQPNGKNPQIKLKAEIFQLDGGTDALIGTRSFFDVITRGSPLKENNLIKRKFAKRDREIRLIVANIA